MGKFLVTGGGGFVGRSLVRALVERGDTVISVARGDYPELRKIGVHTERFDLGCDPQAYRHLFRGIDGVFHVAAKVDMWGPREEFERGNVGVTRNVIDVCRSERVPALLFTSSPSVVADSRDLLGIDESYPYPAHYEALYPETKAIAEKAVLAAHSSSLRTASLRPHLIFGPGDTNLVPTILEKARAGRLVQVGDGSNLSDFTYIDDCVTAHLLAMDALLRSHEAGGRAYFISQGDPVPLWEFVRRVLEIYKVPPVTKKVPFRLAHAAGGILELGAKLFNFEPPLTRFLITEMATSHYFNITAARELLGYRPSVSVWEGLERLRQAEGQ